MAQQIDPLSALGIQLNSIPVPIVALAQDREALGDFEATTDWTVLGNDTVNLAVASEHITGTQSIEFDKVDGAANTKLAGVQVTITSVNCSRFLSTDKLAGAVYISDKANVDYAFIRLGTDSSNYNEWRLADTDITAAIWQSFRFSLDSTQLTVVGNGWNPADITYVVVGVAFDLETNALADIRFDHLLLGVPLDTPPVPIIAIKQDREALGDFSSVAGWTVLGNDTINLAVAPEHIVGTKSLEFDKTDGGANTKLAGVQATITSINCSRFVPTDKIISSVYISNKANVDYAFIRLGTDSSNYNEWRLADSAITAAIWQSFSLALDATELAVTGNGWDPEAVTYVVVGVAFDLETNALPELRFDHLLIESAILTTT